MKSIILFGINVVNNGYFDVISSTKYGKFYNFTNNVEPVSKEFIYNTILSVDYSDASKLDDIIIYNGLNGFSPCGHCNACINDDAFCIHLLNAIYSIDPDIILISNNRRIFPWKERLVIKNGITSADVKHIIKENIEIFKQKK